MILSKGKTMQSKPYLMMTTMWIVLVCAAGNLCFGQSYWKRTYGGEGHSDIQTILPTIDGNFLLNCFWGIIKIKPNGDTIWTKTFEIPAGGELHLKTILSTNDGNFLIGGEKTKSSSEGKYDIFLTKINPNGDTIWFRIFGGKEDDRFQTILPTPDGNFLIGAVTGSFGAGSYDIWLIKINTNGDTIWTKTYGGKGSEELKTIFKTPDNNFLIGGETSSLGAGESDIWIIKINPNNGDTLWSKTYGGIGDDKFQTILLAPDGNFWVGIQTISSYAASITNWLLKINPTGDTLWTETFRGTKRDYLNQILPSSDGNFLIGGYTELFNGRGDIGIKKINPNGDSIWSKSFGGTISEYLQTILPTPDGNFLIGGETESFGAGSQDIWLLKINLNGDTIWTRTFGGAGYEYLKTIIPTIDGNFLIGATTTSFGAGANWLICIIADQYAYKNALFTYKIPTYGEDTLNFGYTPLKVPSGMTVSSGGTISWTPTTDSVYMDHAEFQVVNDAERIDTLTFNVFVNSNYHANSSIKPSIFNKVASKPFKIDTKILKNKIKFSLPSSVTSLCICDINGRIIDKITPTISGSETYATWPSTMAGGTKFPTGKYFAKVSAGRITAVKPFLFCR
jgi:hypothetical protein